MEQQLQEALFELLEDVRFTPHSELEGGPEIFVDIMGPIKNVSTFDEYGVLTMDKGIVLEMKDGNKFYLTIQKG